MRILKTMLRQKAVYWEPEGTNKFGEKKFLDPVEIKCRWEEGGEQTLDFDGKEFVPKHTVYSDRDLLPGGLLRLGEIAELEGPDPPEDAIRIRMIMKTPTLKANKFLRENLL